MSVRAYLVRHGEAKSEDVDHDRHLTDHGTEIVSRIATAGWEIAIVRA